MKYNLIIGIILALLFLITPVIIVYYMPLSEILRNELNLDHGTYELKKISIQGKPFQKIFHIK